MKKFNKQPADVLDYDIDASEWLTAGDNVISAAVTITPAGAMTNSNKTVSDDRIKIWLSGGDDGVTYKVTTIITTEDARTKEVDFEVKVKDE